MRRNHRPGRAVSCSNLAATNLAVVSAGLFPANARLRVHLKLFESNLDAFAVRHSDVFVPADKRGERNRFWRGEGRIPSGAMLHRFNRFAVRLNILIRGTLADELFGRLRMLALAETRKILRRRPPQQGRIAKHGLAIHPESRHVATSNSVPWR